MTIEYRLNCTIVEVDTETGKQTEVPTDRLEQLTTVLGTFDTLGGAIQWRNTLAALQWNADRRPTGKRE